MKTSSLVLFISVCLWHNGVVWGFLWCRLNAGGGAFLQPNWEIRISSHVLQAFSKFSGLGCIFFFLWEVEAADCYPKSSPDVLKEKASLFLLCVRMCCGPKEAQVSQMIRLQSQKYGLWHGEAATCEQWLDMYFRCWQRNNFSECYSRQQRLSSSGGYPLTGLFPFEVGYHLSNSSDRKEVVLCFLSGFVYWFTPFWEARFHWYSDLGPWQLWMLKVTVTYEKFHFAVSVRRCCDGSGDEGAVGLDETIFLSPVVSDYRT